MIKRYVLAIVMPSIFLASPPVSAQWHFSAGGGVRYATVTETDPNGRQLVREDGWLPGLELTARSRWNDWNLGVITETYSGDLDYDGRVQTGAPFSNTTSTTQNRFDLEISHPLNIQTDIVAMLEWDRWKRDIQGKNGILGLNEFTTSNRLLAGMATTFRGISALHIKTQGLLVFAQPERLHVQFDNHVYDDAAFSTKSAVGARLSLELQPVAFPHLGIATEFDWLRIRRSDDAMKYQNGIPAGAINQPEHKRSAFSMVIRYLF